MNFADYFWGDSILNKIEIVYDKITLTIFNDALQKTILIECSECVGMSKMICWDEVIIENITISPSTSESEQIINEAKSLYGNLPEGCGKPFDGDFKTLRVTLIDNLYFNIACKKIDFTEQTERNNL